MKRIILHWTAGGYYPNATDLEHYHFVIDKDGKIYDGKFKPEDNLDCTDKKYAKHTGGGNTGSIGVAVCGMADFRQGDVGRSPQARKQEFFGGAISAEHESVAKKNDYPKIQDADFQGKLSDTKYPLTAVQVEKMFSFTAELCRKYNIDITPDTVLTHYEFGKNHPKTSSAGKIDIICLPQYLSVKPAEVGDFIRKKVKWYFEKTSKP